MRLGVGSPGLFRSYHCVGEVVAQAEDRSAPRRGRRSAARRPGCGSRGSSSAVYSTVTSTSAIVREVERVGRLRQSQLPGGVHAACLERQQQLRLGVQLEDSPVAFDGRGERDRPPGSRRSDDRAGTSRRCRRPPARCRWSTAWRGCPVRRDQRDHVDPDLPDQPQVVAGEVARRTAPSAWRRPARRSGGTPGTPPACSRASENVWDRLQPPPVGARRRTGRAGSGPAAAAPPRSARAGRSAVARRRSARPASASSRRGPAYVPASARSKASWACASRAVAVACCRKYRYTPPSALLIQRYRSALVNWSLRNFTCHRLVALQRRRWPAPARRWSRGRSRRGHLGGGDQRLLLGGDLLQPPLLACAARRRP